MTAPTQSKINTEIEETKSVQGKKVQELSELGIMDRKSIPIPASSLVFIEENDDESSESSSVQVAVRVRPFLQRESGSSTCLDFKSGQQSLRIGGSEGPTFTFDHVFPDTASQKDLYSSCVVPLVRACLKGYNATVFAYGQTGSGKTHTIVGPSIQHEISTSSSGESSFSTSLSSGMIPRAFQDLLFNLSKKKAELCNDSNDNSTSNTKKKTPPYEYEVRIQFLEIYGEEIRDLLAPSSSDTRLTIRDGAAGEEPEVIGASEVTVNTTKEALLCLQKGTLRRVTAATQMNSTSSRSHAMMSVTVEQRTLRKTSFTKKGSSSSNNGENANNSNNSNNSNKQNDDYDDRETEEEVKRSRFHFVDLAGSERQKRTKAEGQRLKEGIDINKGLLVLGNVISALGDSKKVGRTHVPYRDSKLTRLLKGSLGGNHKTLMIACVSPASVNMEESLNCLRYANRAKNIQNNAVVNLDAGSRLVANLRGKCKDLARELLRIRDLCKIDDMEQIVKNVEAGSSYSEKLLLDLASGKDIEIPRGTRKSQLSKEKKKKGPNLSHDFSNENTELFDGTKNISNKDLDYYKLRLAETEVELKMIRQSSQKTKKELGVLKEEHYCIKAEKEYYRLQLPNEIQNISSISIDDEAKNSFVSTSDQDEYNGQDFISKNTFLSKISMYERELADLKKSTQESHQSQSLSSQNPIKSNSTPSIYIETDDEEDTAIREVSELSRKYSPPDDFEILLENKIKAKDYENDTTIETDLAKALQENDKSYQVRQKKLENNILQLSKNISEKEELVDQLNASQGKYEVSLSSTNLLLIRCHSSKYFALISL